MTETDPIVYVVDDDFSFREALDRLLRSIGYTTLCFASIDEFVRHTRADAPSCLLLDIRMPGQSSLDFQVELNKKKDGIPVIFITGHGDVPMSVRAIKNGAVGFLLKPFREQELLDVVREGINRDRSRRETEENMADLLACIKSLSQRERQILSFVNEGRSNKEIAHEIGLQEITIKVHRAKAMKKMKSKSVADLVRKLQNIDLLS
ncbi:MAG: response regulator [Pseudomonadota bacterium]